MKIQQAIEAYKQHKLVAIPTETVYGLSAPIDDEQLIKRIFQLKERPFFDPLIVHVSDSHMAKNCVEKWPLIAEKLAEKFWPGPLTMVLPKNIGISDMITSGLDTVGVRCPNHPLTLELIQQLGKPIAAPSANKFGKTSPTSIEHVQAEFSGDDVFFLDGGDCAVGIESTIIKIEEQKMIFLRKGAITPEMLGPIAEQFKYSIVSHQSEKIEAPGQVKHHYMPKIPMVLVFEKKNSDSMSMAAKALGKNVDAGVFLSLPDDPSLASRKLYSEMRVCAESGAEFICISFKEEWKNNQLWEAILDRLTRASQITC